MSDYLGDGGPYAVAHRGGAGLAPENTLAAFGRSVALGLRYLETDVRLSADGVCMAFHDATLRRVTGATGRVRARTEADLARLRVDGERIPRLEDLLEAFPAARFTVDVKDPEALDPLLAVVSRCRAVDRVCLAGSADRWLAAARDRLPGLVTALGWESMARLAFCARTGRSWGGGRSGARASAALGAQFVHVPLRLGRLPVFADRLVEMAHDLGLRVLVWTVDEPAEMHRLLDAGVDGVITDRPDLLRETLLARGAWRPVRSERPHQQI